MVAVSGAVRAAKGSDAELDEGLGTLAQTVETNRRSAEEAHRDLAGKLDGIAEVLGKPAEAAGGPTGVFKVLASLDCRLRGFEAARHQAIGAVKVAAPMLAAFGAILYFIERAKLAELFAAH